VTWQNAASGMQWIRRRNTRPTNSWVREPCYSVANMALPQGGKDRRHHVRTPPHCKVYFRQQARLAPIRAETRDVSSGGFYCLVNEPVTSSEILTCDLILPESRSRKKAMKITLHCTVEVLRVEEQTPNFGVACQIQDYSVEH
jgi:hypothetical protein